MFRSFMPEDNTVTVSKTPFIGDKTELLFLWTPSVTKERERFLAEFCVAYNTQTANLSS